MRTLLLLILFAGADDPGRAHYASGLSAYQQKQYSVARRELRIAFQSGKKPSTRIAALLLLGSVAQDTKEYDEAFWAFEKALMSDPLRLSAAYEIGETSVLCRCRIERGEEALTRYLAANTTLTMPSKEDAKKLLLQLKSSADRHRAP
jgi:tetratricopeptide (TPR) repeat protein